MATWKGAGRLLWLDAAKAVAVIFVILGHVIRGLHDAGILLDDRAFRLADNAIYLFHMPAFFLISGMLFRRGEWRSFLRKSARNVVLPYFLWGSVIIIMQIALGSAVNAEARWEHLIWLPVRPYSIFWFLYALLIIQIAAQLILPIKHGAWLLLLGGIVASVAEDSLPPKDLGALNDAGTFLVYFAIGQLLSGEIKKDLSSSWRAVCCLIAFVSIDLTIAASGIRAETLDGRSVGALLATLFVSIFIYTPRLKLWERLSRIGKDTIAIYCMHTIFTAGTRVALSQIGILSLPTHIVAGLIAGLVGPLVAIEIARRLGVQNLLGFGSAPPRAVFA